MQNKLRILVIDDDTLSRELLTLLLLREGYTVDAAESGDAALEALGGQRIVSPDAVIADLQMPGVRGAQLARHLRGVCRDARLIAISASVSSNGDIDGYDAFLLKPFSTEALAAALRGNPSPVSDETVRQNVTGLDQMVYNKFAASMRPELVTQLYTLCLTDVRKREAAMRAAAVRGDDTTYRREAHSIKGGAGMVGAVELQTLASAMEDNGIPANYLATLDEFLLACDRLQRMLIARETVPGPSAAAEVARRSNA
jgi:CheY-like chemotaxis protein